MMRSADGPNIPFVPRATFSISCDHVTTDHTRKTCHVFRTTLLWHCWKPLFDAGQNSSHFVVPNFEDHGFSCHPLDGDLSMLARTAKYSAWRSRGRTCVRDFLWYGCNLSQTYFQRMVGCWQSYQPHQATLPPAAACWNARVPFHFAVPKLLNLRPKVVGSACTPWILTIGSSELCVLFRFVGNDVEEVFKVLADDVVGLFRQNRPYLPRQ